MLKRKYDDGGAEPSDSQPLRKMLKRKSDDGRTVPLRRSTRVLKRKYDDGGAVPLRRSTRVWILWNLEKQHVTAEYDCTTLRENIINSLTGALFNPEIVSFNAYCNFSKVHQRIRDKLAREAGVQMKEVTSTEENAINLAIQTEVVLLGPVCGREGYHNPDLQAILIFSRGHIYLRNAEENGYLILVASTRDPTLPRLIKRADHCWDWEPMIHGGRPWWPQEDMTGAMRTLASILREFRTGKVPPIPLYVQDALKSSKFSCPRSYIDILSYAVENRLVVVYSTSPIGPKYYVLEGDQKLWASINTYSALEMDNNPSDSREVLKNKPAVEASACRYDAAQKVNEAIFPDKMPLGELYCVLTKLVRDQHLRPRNWILSS